MITKLRISNFKSLRERTELEFRPLTIIAGANSSGKSAALQPLLLLAQTFANRVGSEPLVLNGPLLQLGTLSDIRSFGATESPITLGVDVEPVELERQLQLMLHEEPRRLDPPYRQLTADFEFDRDEGSIPPDRDGLHPILSGCSIISRNEEGKVAIEARRDTISTGQNEVPRIWKFLNLSNEAVADARKYRVNLDPTSAETISEELPAYGITGCVLRHCLPESLLVSYNKREQIARSVATAISRPSAIDRGRFVRPLRWREYSGFVLPPKVSEYLQATINEKLPQIRLPFQTSTSETRGYSLSDWWNAFGELAPVEATSLRSELTTMAPAIYEILLAELPAQREEEQVELPRPATMAVRTLERYFSSGIRYLGPLRESPKPLYSRSASLDSMDVGLRGENTAAVLHTHKRTFIVFGTPPGSPRPEQMDISRAPLLEAVEEWLKYLGVVDNVVPKDMGKLGHELKVRTHGIERPHDLTNVGVGVSQVLPIVVMCLLARPDSTVILEQPELHLHPAIQARLADFFLSVARTGKQCIVETHSEYLINRLRLRTAQTTSNSLSSLISLYFVEKTRDLSDFRRVTINEFGAILDWPSGFFDQSPIEAEAILRASIAKKKQLRRGDKNE